MRILRNILLLSALATSCTSGLKQAPEFRAAARSGLGRPHRTVVLFLVDGLAVRTLKTGLESGATPNLRRYFLGAAKGFALGEASFPTQTYPNIASILTTKPVGEQPVIANQVLGADGRILPYEDAQFFPQTRKAIDPISVIGDLKREGKETASFSYVFGLNASDHMRVGLQEGIQYTEGNFRSLDDRLIANLEKFLRTRGPQENWPELIYVHLVGVDGTSHRYGPDSPETRAYLAWLDRSLGNTIKLLERAEKRPGSRIVTLLTADHGFVATKRYLPYAKFVRKADLDTVILNEGRFLALHQTGKHPAAELAPVLRKLRARPGVELTALRAGNALLLGKGRDEYRFAIGPKVCDEVDISLALLPSEGTAIPAAGFRCPTEFDDNGSAYPFLVEGVSRYLTVPNHPDALVVPEPQSSFTKGARGSHGGPTADEAYVPVLLRNAELNGDRPVRTSDLLKLLAPASL